MSGDTEMGQTSESSEQEWMRLARVAGSREHGDSEPELLRELLTFELAGSPYAIPVEQVREIVRLREITPMPRVPDSVLGVVALRGEIVQVVDLRMRLNLELSEPTRKSRIIVLHAEEEKITGVVVDAVQEVLRISESDISPATSSDVGAVKELCVRDGQFVSIIEPEGLLDLDAD